MAEEISSSGFPIVILVTSPSPYPQGLRILGSAALGAACAPSTPGLPAQSTGKEVLLGGKGGLAWIKALQ